MGKSKYGNFLTVILIIVIVAIVGVIGYFGYSIIKDNKDKAMQAQAANELDQNAGDSNQTEENNAQEMTGPTENNTATGGNTIKKTYYKGFVMVGYITIPKTNINKLPILDKETPQALETSVAIRYPSNATLNQPGNVVIAGHNYRNGKFFSNNKKLAVGDIIKIKDISGTELTYTIYSVFETTPEDTSFYNRDTNGGIEVTLTTCTDDSSARTIVCAKVQ